ncbi:MAG: hypothetical protein JSU63_09970, partial [Phycisphaerales bacterium]
EEQWYHQVCNPGLRVWPEHAYKWCAYQQQGERAEQNSKAVLEDRPPCLVPSCVRMFCIYGHGQFDVILLVKES